MKIAFGASTSSTSINRRFANYAAAQIAGAEVTDLDLRDFELPIYSADQESEEGITDGALKLGFDQAIADFQALT